MTTKALKNHINSHSIYYHTLNFPISPDEVDTAIEDVGNKAVGIDKLKHTE